MEILVSLFNELRSCFFPRWDIKREWKIEVRDRTEAPGGGYCDRENKTISVSPPWSEADDDDLCCLLIHEMSHAVTNDYHGKKWEVCFLTAADKALGIGQIELADKIRSEVKTYRESPRTIAHYVYCTIHDAVSDQPDASMDAVIAWVASYYAFTPQELLKRYRKAEKIFYEAKYEAKEEVAQMKVARAKFDELVSQTGRG